MSADTSVVEFKEGLPGFEASRRFVLHASPDTEPFAIVRGLGPDAPSFLAIDPSLVAGAYRAELTDADRARLEADEHAQLLWLAIVSATPEGVLTANLRAPLVINPANMRGIQLIPTESVYAFDHPLSAA